MNAGRRPLPEGREEMEADVRAVIRDLEASGQPVTAGHIREVYGGRARGSWQPHGDPERPDVPPDSLDPLLEEVLRDLSIAGATPGPEPLPEPESTRVHGRVDSPELPLVDFPSGPVVAIEDKPTVSLLSSTAQRGPRSILAPRTEWTVQVIGRNPAQSFDVRVPPQHIDRTGRVDLDAVRDLLAARGVHVEPAHRWHRPSLDLYRFRIKGSRGSDQGPWEAAPTYAPRRPVVRVRPTEVRSLRHPQVLGWEYTIDTGSKEMVRLEAVADRHVTETGDLNIMAFAEELRAKGIALAEPAEHLLVPELLRHSRYAMLGGGRSHAVGEWRTLADTTFIGEPPPLAIAPVDAVPAGGKLKWVVGGVGGMLVAVVAIPAFMGDDDAAAPAPAAVDQLDDVEEEPVDSPLPVDPEPTPSPAVDDALPLVLGDPPATYREPDLGFDAAPADQRVDVEGSVWGTSTWTEVDVAAKPQGNFTGSPPPTVAPEGHELVVEFVIHADCTTETDPQTCAFSVDRGTDRVLLLRDGLSLTGAGDEITDGCGGQSGVEFQVSDLTVVDGRLVPTYLAGRRFFRESCPGWDRFLDIEHNGRYVDRPSSTP